MSIHRSLKVKAGMLRARNVWTRTFRRFFNRENYRFVLEVRRFIQEREQAYAEAEATAQNAALPAPSPPR